MAVPVYLFLYDDNGTLVKGGVDIKDRERSIEILELMHGVELPVDDLVGKITGKRLHSSYAFEKEIDSSSPYLYQALTTGKSLKKAEFRFYKINDAGMEEHYFTTLLEDVKISEIETLMMDVKDRKWGKHTHHEYVDLHYKKITWHYLDGNIIHSDSWLEGREKS
jgi:type VI secretion system secreted protein Hcp